MLAQRLERDSAGRAVVGVGVDLVDLDRFRLVLHRTPGVVARVFTADEQAYASAARDPAERYAVRFAAKEAVLKALRVGVFHVPLTEIEVARDDESGAPSLVLHGKAQRAARERGIDDWLLTLTHIGTAAEAVALALRSH